MILYEALPRAAATGLHVGRIGIAGNSMGGYGALLLAERLGGDPAQDARPPRAAAVVALSPAIFGSYADARAANPGAFDGPASFAGHDVLARAPNPGPGAGQRRLRAASSPAALLRLLGPDAAGRIGIHRAASRPGQYLMRHLKHRV